MALLNGPSSGGHHASQLPLRLEDPHRLNSVIPLRPSIEPPLGDPSKLLLPAIGDALDIGPRGPDGGPLLLLALPSRVVFDTDALLCLVEVGHRHGFRAARREETQVVQARTDGSCEVLEVVQLLVAGKVKSRVSGRRGSRGTDGQMMGDEGRGQVYDVVDVDIGPDVVAFAAVDGVLTVVQSLGYHVGQHGADTLARAHGDAPDEGWADDAAVKVAFTDAIDDAGMPGKNVM